MLMTEVVRARCLGDWKERREQLRKLGGDIGHWVLYDMMLLSW